MGFKNATTGEFDEHAFMARVEERFRAFNYETQRPTTTPDGTRQAAPQTFSHWLSPGIWQDTEGNAHFDIAMMLRIFELPATKDNRQQVMNFLHRALRETGNNAEVRVQTDEGETFQPPP